MIITNLDKILISLTDFCCNRTYDRSLLTEELTRVASSSAPIDAIISRSLITIFNEQETNK